MSYLVIGLEELKKPKKIFRQCSRYPTLVSNRPSLEWKSKPLAFAHISSVEYVSHPQPTCQHVTLKTCIYSSIRSEGKFVPAHVMSAHRVSVNMDPVVLKLSARCRRVFSLMPPLFNPQTNSRFHIRGGPG
jgi:hypothetical protein